MILEDNEAGSEYHNIKHEMSYKTLDLLVAKPLLNIGHVYLYTATDNNLTEIQSTFYK